MPSETYFLREQSRRCGGWRQNKKGDSVGTRTQGLLLRRQLLYPAELRNRPCASVISQCGCKGRHFLGNIQILDGKSYVGTVIEGVITLDEGFGGLELTDVERVSLTLMRQT